jgi:hypothetical protein
MKPAGNEKATRRRWLFQNLFYDLAPTAEATGNATTITNICSESVNRKCQDLSLTLLTPFQLFTPFQPPVETIEKINSPRGADAYQGLGVLDAYQVGSAPVPTSYSRCSAPLDILKYIRRRAQRPRAFLLRLEKLRVSRYALPPAALRAGVSSHWFSKLAFQNVLKHYGTEALTHAEGGLRR